MALVLASSSPRRRALLAEMGLDFDWLDPGDDGPSASREPAARVLDHARHKARAGARLRPDAFVLAADTLVVRDGAFLPKPRDRDDAEAMLRSLSGRDHEVWTGVVLVTESGDEREVADRAVVRFRTIAEEELATYLAGPEWCDKAGAYGFQGEAGRWAEIVRGDRETVIGLSTATVRRMLAEAGIGSPAPGR